MSDLILAAVAHHQVAVMYYDRDFDRIAEISGQPVEWVAPAGAVA